MWTRQHKQTNRGRLIVPAISAVFLSYFGFHAYHGEFGIYSKYQYITLTNAAQLRLDAIRKRRVDAERRVALLHDGTIERDMLDEQARRGLNVSRADEITIMLPSASH